MWVKRGVFLTFWASGNPTRRAVKTEEMTARCVDVEGGVPLLTCRCRSDERGTALVESRLARLLDSNRSQFYCIHSRVTSLTHSRQNLQADSNNPPMTIPFALNQ
ncbi:hypothetical protein EDB83DRAFT_2435328 [Lactarius deliciosus]|nr:hypothetical protein EDB83DRAFT_2435328 [Lactarius deliciosus]